MKVKIEDSFLKKVEASKIKNTIAVARFHTAIWRLN